VNTDAPWPAAEEAGARVLEIQTKLHRWAKDNPTQRFDDLFNLVCDPAFLTVAWKRVRGNRGSRSAGVDGDTARYITAVRGEDKFLAELRADLKAQTLRPLPVRERMIPKAGGKRRRLGIPTVRDRVAQAALKLVLEPIFEADFQPCSYGFRPGRRAHDAMAEIHLFASENLSYEWVFEGDIKACFDEISHSALMDRMRKRIGDKRVLSLVKAFLKAGILTEEGAEEETNTGTPQGGILSPLLANIALSALDEYFAGTWAPSWEVRRRRRDKGGATYRLVRYADDFVVMVKGTRAHAENLREQVAEVLRPIGLRLSETKTTIAHIDEGFEFLGHRIQRMPKRGAGGKRYVYTYPDKDALAGIKGAIRELTSPKNGNLTLAVLLHRINQKLRGWTNYFRHAASSATFGYLWHYTWWRVCGWLRRKHPRRSWKWLRSRYFVGRWRPAEGMVKLFNPSEVAIVRHRYRGQQIPTPWHDDNERPTP
jgi:RNA-directed DNA polymerase